MSRNSSGWNALGRLIGEALRRRFGAWPQPTPSRGGSADGGNARSSGSGDTYPGDFHEPFTISYEPHPDNTPDPGEIVWTWVPYEEDHSKGKDRPVVIVGRHGNDLLAVPMTSKDHDPDAAQEAGEGRYWVDIGSGDWDRSGRASEVRVNRIITVDPSAVRRIACRLDQSHFEQVAQGIQRHW